MDVIRRANLKITLFSALAVLLLSFSHAGAEEKDTYHKQWKKMESEGRFAEAEQLYKRAVEEYPEEAWFYVFIGHSLKMQKKADAALPYFESAGKFANGDAGVLRNVYYGYCAYGSFLGFEKKRWDQAAEWFGRAAGLDPKPAFAHNVMGNALRNAGQIDKAYTAFLSAYEADPSHVNGDLKANFRVGMLEGMRQTRSTGSKRLLLNYALLAARAYPDDLEIMLSAAAGILFAGRLDKAKEVEASVLSQPMKDLIHGRIELETPGQESKVFSTFDAMSRKSVRDYELDDAIAKIYRSLVDTLDYPDQMKSPYQDRVVDFNTRAVKKYFVVHPYQQSLTLVPPLVGAFRLDQGAGGRSFHNGLEAHFSYDLRQEMGSPIHAVADGEVVDTQSSEPDNPIGSPVNLKAKANFVKVRHGGGIVSTYVHMKQGSVIVTAGQKVKAGQKLGGMGNSGVSGGVHLHFVMQSEKRITLEPQFTGLKGKKAKGDGAYSPVQFLREERFFEYNP